MESTISRLRTAFRPKPLKAAQPPTTAPALKNAGTPSNSRQDWSDLRVLSQPEPKEHGGLQESPPQQVSTGTDRPSGMMSSLEGERGVTSRDGGATLVMLDEPAPSQQDDDFTSSAMRTIFNQMLETATLGPKASDESNAKAVKDITGQMQDESTASRWRQRGILHDQDKDHHDAIQERIQTKAKSQEVGARIARQVVQSTVDASRRS